MARAAASLLLVFLAVLDGAAARGGNRAELFEERAPPVRPASPPTPPSFITRMAYPAYPKQPATPGVPANSGRPSFPPPSLQTRGPGLDQEIFPRRYIRTKCPTPKCPDVRVDVNVTKIVKIDDKTKTFNVVADLTFQWSDWRLQAQANEPTRLDLRQMKQLWLPFIKIKRLKREELNLQPLDASGFGPFDTETYLWPNRTVIMNRNVVLSIGFKTDLKVKIHVFAEKNISAIQTPPFFQLDEMETEVGGVRLVLHRHTVYYTLQVYIPCYLIVTLSWVPLYVTYRRATRIKLAATAVLTMIAYSAGFRSIFPLTQDRKAVDSFFILCISFVCASCFATILMSFIKEDKNTCCFCLGFGCERKTVRQGRGWKRVADAVNNLRKLMYPNWSPPGKKRNYKYATKGKNCCNSCCNDSNNDGGISEESDTDPSEGSDDSEEAAEGRIEYLGGLDGADKCCKRGLIALKYIFSLMPGYFIICVVIYHLRWAHSN